jgi:hypothetical protein
MTPRQIAIIEYAKSSRAARRLHKLACSLGACGWIALGCGSEVARAPPPAGGANPSNGEPLPEASTPSEASPAYDTHVDPLTDVGADTISRVDGISCEALVQQEAVVPGLHLPDCTHIQYATNPPSSGDHYASWIAHKTYAVPVPRGFLVHNLEHAATVIWYNCPHGCAGEIAAAQEFIDALPVDPLCPPAGPKRRVLMVPDPFLDTKWAVSVWGWTLRAACFDRAAFGQFVSSRYGQGPENFCSDGIDLIDADGGLRVPPHCGTPSFDAGSTTLPTKSETHAQTYR